ncbi:MAG: hypothetical protein ACKOWJ_01155 [Micrococcales bacterium]
MRNAKTIGFAVADEDRALLDQLVEQYGNGNRSEFLRVAMKRMARQAFAERFNGIKAAIRSDLGSQVFTEADVEVLVRQIKGKSADD